MLKNPKCPVCDSNRRVIASFKRPAGTLFGGPAYHDNILWYYRCITCIIEFKGKQING